MRADFLGEAIDVLLDEGEGVFRFVVQKRRQIDAPDERLILVDQVTLEKSRIGQATPAGGKIVPFAAANLRIENAHQRVGQVAVAVDRHHHLVAVAEPIEVAPDLATDDLGRAFFFR